MFRRGKKDKKDEKAIMKAFAPPPEVVELEGEPKASEIRMAAVHPRLSSVGDSVKDRLIEVLDSSTFKSVMDPNNYVDPTDWMKEHIKKHPEYLKEQASAVMILPFTFEVGENGIGYVGRCICNICKADHSMTDIDNW